MKWIYRSNSVIPAKAGIYNFIIYWIPAFAGMTTRFLSKLIKFFFLNSSTKKTPRDQLSPSVFLQKSG
ncbi:MAG: hypothetical protein CO002_04395 [Candidatus Portnoybacteria bacterium CG_4_8_14_3_um_filter_44_10]|uniref:Uncharacterized protein n=4 Tax=Candidatus Portnoyibacteriota TaxID=1817913 RepID=A0A2H0WVV9_9BACT|nr:MAG: hypothetical protein AUK17_02505 [Parcubacteria group bacterium CG2_30_44_18]PIS16800.1 MAG: hypothetical protein COT61_02035 [Candidatus Portnoybacteria bacterium CG09_land_8_20_14_0_10_44_13]PIW75017.1 MAG: hypothetical protein CO002_04395 [Candidatus Portnoybacteria bacterium CG_4_8_14_3_um_filter_44_10]PIZ70494.1 MAG: hypothetical protein COY11_02540 [Candidatus Portnoybacteria bacterium CG_4_10_14_0_2_um_filter_44_20]PJA63366.1 MAG: hypothetical protein CO161_01455 [Candidatus Port